MNGVRLSGIRARILVAALALTAWFGVVLARLVQLQVVEHARYESEVLGQNQNQIDIVPRRGTIFDRNGAILARSLPARAVYLSQPRGTSPEESLRAVAEVRRALPLSEADVARVEARVRKGSSYILLRKKVDEETAARLAGLGLKSLFFEEDSIRFYPQGPLAAQVLGDVGGEDRGLAGVESAYDGTLAGKTGRKLIWRDARRREYQFETLREAVPGRDLRLTLDAVVQYFAETALDRAVRESGAAWGTAVVLAPRTGEVLAMASAPGFDPNVDAPSGDRARNRAVQDAFEPGSTFKIVTASAARAGGRVRFTDVFDCSDGAIEVGGKAIRDHKRLGLLTFIDVIAESSNVGTVQVARRVGADALFDMIERFRFGRATGVGLPGESRGLVAPLARWNPVFSLPHVAIGYEVSVTALQVAQAMNVLAARGAYVRPRIILDETARGDGAGERVLPETVASELTHLVFEKVVEEGTGTAARLDGYTAAGKTGTAQLMGASGGYTSARHLASFVGFAPADDPAVTIMVAISDPRGSDRQYGGQSAAPVFREIAARTLRYLGVPPAPAPPADAPRIVAAARLGGIDAP